MHVADRHVKVDDLVAGGLVACGLRTAVILRHSRGAPRHNQRDSARAEASPQSHRRSFVSQGRRPILSRARWSSTMSAQELQKRRMQFLIGGQNVAGFEYACSALKIGGDAAGLPDKQ